MSGFHIAGGKIIDPDGNVFRAVGANIYWLRKPSDTLAQLFPNASCSKFLANFPGANFIRIVCETGYTQAELEPYVGWLTALKIVVSICDFNISPGKPAATGATLAAQTAWYAGLAQTYKNNPYVWLESQNEMYDVGTVMSARHKTLYDAVRAASPDKIVFLGLPAGGNPGTVGVNGNIYIENIGRLTGPMTASVYAAMTGIVWNLHVYAWIVNKMTGTDSIDIAVIQEVIRGDILKASGIRAAQTFTSQDGKVPVIIGEFGNSTTGSKPDPNGVPLVEAVGTMPEEDTAGWCIFAAGTANIGVPFFNALTDTNGNLTNPYGLQGQRLIKAATDAVVVPPVFTESVNNTVIDQASDPAIVGSTGESWTLTAGGQIAVNGVADTSTRNVVGIAYVNHTVWQQNAGGWWWGKSVSTGAWSPPTGTATSPLPATPSPDGAKVIAPSVAALNYAGSLWTIVGGVVFRDGVATPSANAVQIRMFGGGIWLKNIAGNWYHWPTDPDWTLEPMAVPAN